MHRAFWNRAFAIFAIFALACVWSACERPPATAPAPQEPPEWVRQAVERSKRGAQPTVDATPQAPADAPLLTRPLLWRVVSAEGGTSHLLGTFHIGTDFHGIEALPVTVQQAFESAHTVVLEADTGAVEAELPTDYMFLPRGKSLRAALGDTAWSALREELDLPEEQLDRTQPWVVSAQLTASWIPNAGPRGMDDRVRILARAYDKRLVFLETIAEQAKLLSRILTAEHLADTLARREVERARTLQALADFRRGDAEALAAWLSDPELSARDPRFMDELLTKRNKAWVRRLETDLDKGGILVVVGAGHLLGTDSVVALLQEANFDVSRVE